MTKAHRTLCHTLFGHILYDQKTTICSISWLPASLFVPQDSGEGQWLELSRDSFGFTLPRIQAPCVRIPFVLLFFGGVQNTEKFGQNSVARSRHGGEFHLIWDWDLRKEWTSMKQIPEGLQGLAVQMGVECFSFHWANITSFVSSHQALGIQN